MLERLTRLRHSIDDISDTIRLLEKDLCAILYDLSDSASDASRPESPVVFQPLKPPPLKTKRSRIIYMPDDGDEITDDFGQGRQAEEEG